MYKLAPILMLTAVAGVSIPVPVVAAQRLMAPLSGPSAVDTVVPRPGHPRARRRHAWRWHGWDDRRWHGRYDGRRHEPNGRRWHWRHDQRRHGRNTQRHACLWWRDGLRCHIRWWLPRKWWRLCEWGRVATI